MGVEAAMAGEEEEEAMTAFAMASVEALPAVAEGEKGTEVGELVGDVDRTEEEAWNGEVPAEEEEEATTAAAAAAADAAACR